jgi:hypothetical protein
MADTPDPLATWRAYRPTEGPLSNAANDAAAQQYYSYVRDNPDVYASLSPTEQIQYQYLRYVNGEISGNNKDDQIKRIRQDAGMPQEKFADDDPTRDGTRQILRNKPTQPDRRDGITAGDVFAIGDYTQTDRGQDGSAWMDAQINTFNKMLPGFNTKDIVSLPYIDEAAAIADFFFMGAPSFALNAVREGVDGNNWVKEWDRDTTLRALYAAGHFLDQADGKGIIDDILGVGKDLFGGGGGDGGGMDLSSLLGLLGGGGGATVMPAPPPPEYVGKITPYDLKNVLGVAGQEAGVTELLQRLKNGDTLSEEDMASISRIA